MSKNKIIRKRSEKKKKPTTTKNNNNCVSFPVIPAAWTTENDPLRSRGSLISKWRRLGKEAKQEKGKHSLFFSISYGRLYSKAGLCKEVPTPVLSNKARLPQRAKNYIIIIKKILIFLYNSKMFYSGSYLWIRRDV